MSAWFPRPTSVEDVELLAPSPAKCWTAAEVLAFLADREGEEWRHKVCVAGREDGSAKATTRLFAARGWVGKLRSDLRFPSPIEARRSVADTLALRARARLWHPEKQWALVRAEGDWYPLTICPELVTLRRITLRDERWAAWIEMIQAAVDIFDRHQIGLDLNPANFGRPAAGDGPLYYVDDEVYSTLSERNLAGAMVARIPEEPDADEEAWRRWGGALRALSLGALSRDRLADEAHAYPIAERFERKRAALVRGLAELRSAGDEDGGNDDDDDEGMDERCRTSMPNPERSSSASSTTARPRRGRRRTCSSSAI